MKKWFKALGADLNNLSKGHFFLKYILPMMALFFCWGLADNLLLVSTNKDSLVKTSGQVSLIGMKWEQGVKTKSHLLIIELTNSPVEFRLSDTYKTDFDYLQNKIAAGDTIIIFTLSKRFMRFGWGGEKNICQIEKNGKTLFFFAEIIAEKKSQVMIFAVLSIIAWLSYIAYRLTRT